MGKMIQTVLGPIEAKDLGKTLEQLAVRRAMSEAIPAASGSK